MGLTTNGSAATGQQKLPYDKHLLFGTGARLPISDQVVHDVLFAQPRCSLPAAELAQLFGASSGAERQHLLAVIARVGELAYTSGGVPIVRLKKGAGGGRAKKATKPAPAATLPIEAIEVRRVLLVQPGYQMEAGRLRALFAPQGEAQRQALAVAISEVAEMVREPPVAAQAAPQIFVRLKRPDRQEPGRAVSQKANARATPEGGGGGGGAGRDKCGPLPTFSKPSTPAGKAVVGGSSCSSVATEGEAGEEEMLPVTSMERELVEHLLRSAPERRMPVDEMVRLLAPSGEKARRRLSLVLSKVARVVQVPAADGSTETCFTLRAAASEASQLSQLSQSQSQSQQQRGDATTDVHATPRTQPRPRPAPRALTAAAVVDVLREVGGRMLTGELISVFEPMDAAQRKLLSEVIATEARVELAPGVREATVVLREAIVRERTERRVAAVVQRRWRAWSEVRQEELQRHTAAALPLQSAARRLLAANEADARRRRRDQEARAAASLQAGARGHSARAHAATLRDERARVRAALSLQAMARRWCRARAAVRRLERRDDAAVTVQAAARRRSAVRERRTRARTALLASETPEQAAAREERERRELLREKLKKRRAREQSHSQPAA